MADGGTIQQTALEKTGPAEPAEAAPTEEAAPAVPSVDVDALRRENSELRAVAERSAADAAAARDYVQNLVSTMASREAEPTGSPQEAFAEDPLLFTDKLIETKVAPIRREYVENQAQLNYQLAEASLRNSGWAEEWNEYKNELGAFLQTMPAEARAKPGSVEAAFKFVIANHLDDVTRKRQERQMRAEQLVTLEAPSTGAPAPGKKPATLTEEEAAVSRGLGMSAEEYLKWKAV